MIILSASEVLDLIDPCDPDNLTHLGQGVYRASWIRPVPPMEPVILRRTPGITIREDVIDERGWCFITFTVDRTRPAER
ncbi:MAG: hypothetical protein JW910_09400 [Anaerolineae bacterium]|nr:hypothetical protein [Anaerolineae bacterium]